MNPRAETRIRVGVRILITGSALLVLAAVIGAGYLFYKAFVPERMTLSGRVTDATGNPIPLARIFAVPEPVYLDYIEDPIQTGAVVYSTTCDAAGRFRLERLIVGGGVKEGLWTQPYQLQATAPGYQRETVPFRRTSKQTADTSIPDIVLKLLPNPETPGLRITDPPR